MKLYQYLNERYGMTKTVFNLKPDWAKEELRKEHQDYCKQMQFDEVEQRRWDSLSDQEKENEEVYNNLIGSGIPQSFVEQIF